MPDGTVTAPNGAFLPKDNNGTDAWNTYAAWLAAGNTPDAYVPPVAPERTTFTKLAIRRACRRLNVEAQLNALIAASPEFASDWADAQEINLSDPVLVSALTQATLDVPAIKADIIANGG